MAKQTSGQASQSQKTSESQKTAKKTTKKTEHVLEQTPKSLLIGTGMTLLGGAMWGMNSTVAKLLMRDYQLDPIWLSCVRALFASLIFLVGSAIAIPQKLAGAVKDVKSYPKYLVTTLICVLLVQVSYLMTIDWTNSGTATVLQTLNLIFVLAWVCLRGKRLPSSVNWSACSWRSQARSSSPPAATSPRCRCHGRGSHGDWLTR